MDDAPRVYFGGPGRPARLLRDLLELHVDAVPSGGAIGWMTYYFRDERLAEALVRAHERGVKVQVCVEGRPRCRGANDRVVSRLHLGIGSGLRVDTRLFGASHLHTKLYCFSHPRPHVLVGSFNPSGNEPEDATVIADIGDQDRGHNLLVEVDEPKLVEAFVRRVAAIHSGANPFGALSAPRKATAAGDGLEASFFPRRGANPLERWLAGLDHGATLRIAASHFRDGRIANELIRLARTGARIEVLTHHTLRRSPEPLVQRLRDGGVRTWRYEHPDDLPMHAKFILAEDAGRRWSAFGSYNLSLTSRWLNQELLVFSSDEELWRELDRYWHDIMSERWCKE